MAFNKFDPHRPETPEEMTRGERLARILRVVNWIVLVYTALGFGFAAYWLFR